MYIKRLLENEIILAIENYTKPICVLGARQVGKTTMIKNIVTNYNHVYVNMLDTKDIGAVFNEGHDLNVDRIITDLELILNKTIEQDSIIIIDEIQSSADALASLKSFNEDKRYKVIALGSNLGSHLLINTNRSFPVGQIRRFYLYPLSFSEFLVAKEEIIVHENIIKSLKKQEIGETLHNKALILFDEYIRIGAMPEVVLSYLNNSSINEMESLKQEILDGYIDDFGKYQTNIDNSKALNIIYRSIAQFLNKDNQKFIFSEIKYEYKQLASSLAWLESNNYVNKIPLISSINLPLISNVSNSAFKLFTNETSMLLKMSNYNIVEIQRQQDKIYYGFVMENYVSNVLTKHFREVYCYKKNKTEIDFICELNGSIIAVEVKSGNNTKAKSLSTFRLNNPDVITIKLSRNELSLGAIKSIPLYAIDYIFEYDINDII